MNKPQSQNSSTPQESAFSLLRQPVKIVFFAVIACVIYLSTHAFFAMGMQETSESELQKDKEIEPDPVVEPIQAAILPKVTLPNIDYDHPIAPTQITHRVRSGDTLGQILKRHGVARDDINRVVTCRSECKDLHSLMPGMFLDVRLNQNSNLLSLVKRETMGASHRYDFSSDEISVEKTEVVKEAIPTYQHVTIRKGESPISAALRTGNIRESTVLRATQILEYDIDFWRNIRPDDAFEIYFDQLFVNGIYSEDGDIYVLKFTNRGQLFTAYLHEDGMHYEADGSAIRKQFLKAPLQYKRISSRFSNARKHPILGYTRAHRGVDYAAPTGTPVRSTANGTVSKVIRNDPGAGNYITVQHANGFKTRYFHLSRFARGMRAGIPVTRGSTIGYVGSTGLSTGPHLHYEVIKNGRHLNPLNVPNPSVASLAGIQKQQFLQNVITYDDVMAGLQEVQQATDPLATIR